MNRINVRLDPDIGERLDAFCIRTRRNTTNAVNLLLDAALKIAETSPDLEEFLRRPTS